VVCWSAPSGPSRRNCGPPKLQPTMLCRILGITRSRLYRLFEQTGGSFGTFSVNDC
jgi:hypothetical protein